MSISRKLTVIILSITVVRLVLACVLMVSYDPILYRRAMVTDVSTLADLVADKNTTAALTFYDEQAAQDVLQSPGPAAPTCHRCRFGSVTYRPRAEHSRQRSKN